MKQIHEELVAFFLVKKYSALTAVLALTCMHCSNSFCQVYHIGDRDPTPNRVQTALRKVF